MDTKKMVKRGRLVVTVALCHTAHLLPIVLQFRVMELHAAVEEHLIFWEEKSLDRGSDEPGPPPSRLPGSTSKTAGSPSENYGPRRRQAMKSA